MRRRPRRRSRRRSRPASPAERSARIRKGRLALRVRGGDHARIRGGAVGLARLSLAIFLLRGFDRVARFRCLRDERAQPSLVRIAGSDRFFLLGDRRAERRDPLLREPRIVVEHANLSVEVGELRGELLHPRMPRQKRTRSVGDIGSQRCALADEAPDGFVGDRSGRLFEPPFARKPAQKLGLGRRGRLSRPGVRELGIEAGDPDEAVSPFAPESGADSARNASTFASASTTLPFSSPIFCDNRSAAARALSAFASFLAWT